MYKYQNVQMYKGEGVKNMSRIHNNRIIKSGNKEM